MGLLSLVCDDGCKKKTVSSNRAAASTPAVGSTWTPEEEFKTGLPVFAAVSEKWILWLALSHHFCMRRLHATSVSPSQCAESRQEEAANCFGSSADYKYHDAPVSLRQTGGESAGLKPPLIRWHRWKPEFHSCWGIGLHVRGGELVSTATSDESEGWRKHESLEVIKWEVNKDAEGLVMMTHTCPWGVPLIILYLWFVYVEPFGIGIILSQSSEFPSSYSEFLWV